jgi:dual specificity tyrosine-phosphorylation-regulated kinase 2/3/4
MTPRSRVDELKALRSTSLQHKKKITASTLVSAISSIVSNSESNSNNNTLVIFKPSVPLIPQTAKSSSRSQRQNFVTYSLNTSLNSLNSSQKLTPKPPSRSREEPKQEVKIQNLQEEFEKLSLPVTPSTALKVFKPHLSNFEQNELQAVKEIYYMGFKCPKADNGNNFDDENGNFKLYKGDHIYYRYEILQLLGRGSFGQVCKCFDHKIKDFVAIKLIKNKRRYHHQAEIEIKILKSLKKKDKDKSNNVIHVADFFYFRKHVCICFELLSISLYELLKNNGFKGLSHRLVNRFAVQILIALKFTRSLNIIHCDLKPENILLKKVDKSGIKVIDFGSSCLLEERIYTYIQSRFYRAPEIILGIPYTTAIDMWSFGCILVELVNGKPLFPGESEAEQLQLIMEAIGVPPAEVLNKATKRKIFFDSSNNPRMLPNSKGKVRYPATRPLVQVLPSGDKHFFELVVGKD